MANIQSEANVIFSKFLKETQVVPVTRSTVSEDPVTSEGCARGIAISCPAPGIFGQHLLQ